MKVGNFGTLWIPAGQTLTFPGNYTQEGTGLLRIGISNDTDYGRLHIGGTADLPPNARIDVDVSNVDFVFTVDLLKDVIKAGTINSAGTFNVTDNSLLFVFDAVLNGNSVDLTLTPVGGSTPEPGSTEEAAPAAAVAATPVATPAPAAAPTPTGLVEQIVVAQGNQPGVAAAQAVDTIIASDTTNPVSLAFVPFTTEEQVDAAVTQTVPLLVGNSQAATGSALSGVNRVIQARQPAGLGLSSGEGFIGDEHGWVKPFGSRTSQQTRKGVSGYTANTAGLAIGVDGQVSSATRLGVSFAYADATANGRSSVAPNRVEVDVFQLVGYGSYALVGETDVTFQLGLGYNENSGTRRLPSFNREAASNYDSLVTLAGVGLNHTYTVSDETRITASVKADYSRISDDAYTESGAGPLNLIVPSRTSDQLLLSVAGELNRTVDANTVLSANVGLSYDALNEQTTITSAFVGAPGVSFTTQGLDSSPWLASAGLGVDRTLQGGTELTARYDVEGRDGFFNQTASLRARWAF